MTPGKSEGAPQTPPPKTEKAPPPPPKTPAQRYKDEHPSEMAGVSTSDVSALTNLPN